MYNITTGELLLYINKNHLTAIADKSDKLNNEKYDKRRIFANKINNQRHDCANVKNLANININNMKTFTYMQITDNNVR